MPRIWFQYVSGFWKKVKQELRQLLLNSPDQVQIMSTDSDIARQLGESMIVTVRS